jgi:hypothetical protein
LALSQAPPVLELEIANYTPLTKIPGKSPPMAVGPKKRPIMKGDPITYIIEININYFKKKFFKNFMNLFFILKIISKLSKK